MHLTQQTLQQTEKKIAVSIIVTVFNEEETIVALLQSLTCQTFQPEEIIIVDGGSFDRTWSRLEQQQAQLGKQRLKIFQKEGNRSIGRNLAIEKASSALIAITDAGCLPKKNWLEELIKAYQQSQDLQTVVAGYYDAQAKTSFEQAVAPYALVMPDRVNEQTFLPATRSMLLPKAIWKKLGGFDRRFSDNEDYDFARRLQRKNIPIVFAPKAQVSWRPRSNLFSFWHMIYRFARGDAYAKLFRVKVVFIFIRYGVGLGVLFLWWPLALAGLTLYAIWAIIKNIRYVADGWYWLPLLQITSDLAVMAGTLHGLYYILRQS